MRDPTSPWRAVFEYAAIGLARVDLASARWLEVNDAFCALVGYTRAELLAIAWPDITHPEDVDLDLEPFSRMARGELDTYVVEKRFMHKRGDTVWARLTLSLVRDAAGRPDYEVAVIEDITTRRQAQAAQAEIARRYQALFETVHAAGLMLDLEGRVSFANDYLLRLTGWSAQEVIGQDWFARFVPDQRGPDGESLRDVFIANMARGEIFAHYENEIHTRDGRRRTIAWDNTLLRDASGRTIGTASIGRDVTDERAHAVALQQSEERLRLALEATAAGVYDWQVDSGRLTWSPGHYYVLGLSPDVGPPSYELWRRHVHPEDIGRVEAALQDALRTGSRYRAEYRIAGADGTERWVLGQGVVHMKDGRALRMVGTMVDITERKHEEQARREAEAQLREADRRKDEFIATLAHELRNPLAPLRSALGILERSNDPALLAQARTIMTRQLGQMVRLIDDLLDVSRVASGKLQLARECVALARVLQQAVETARPRIEARHHRLVMEDPCTDLWLHGDPLRLAQIFTNLLNNAAKYSDPGGTITLRVAATAERVRVTVADTGIGIPAESLPRVFELFTQIDHGTDKAQGGLGIGLSLALRLVELHGGSITAASDGIGRGARFTVELPLARELPAPETASAGEDPVPAGGCRVLIADDNRDAADSLALLLRLNRHAVDVAYDGRSAIDTVLNTRPDVAIIDIGMPQFDGYQVARRLRAELGPELTLIALTGWGQDADRRRSEEAGFDHHLTKPVNLAQVEALLAKARCTPAAPEA